MSDAVTLDYGIFPPDRVVEIEGIQFVRYDTRSYHLGKIAVYDRDEDPELKLASVPAGMKTRDEALMWLAGFRSGRERGVQDGRLALQRDLRALLDVRS